MSVDPNLHTLYEKCSNICYIPVDPNDPSPLSVSQML